MTTGTRLGNDRRGQRIETVKRQTGGHSWAILMALCERDLKRRGWEWWALVQAVTARLTGNAQAALVRAAAMNLCRRLRLAREAAKTCRLTFYRNNVPCHEGALCPDD